MHKGVLRACGTLPQLTALAGRHYVLQCAFQAERADDVVAYVQSVAPDARLQRLFTTVGTWTVAKTESLRFSALWRAMSAPESFVLDFTLNDVGFTQVFESIVQEKEDEIV